MLNVNYVIIPHHKSVICRHTLGMFISIKEHFHAMNAQPHLQTNNTQMIIKKSVHRKEKDLLCMECNKAFSTRDNLVQHIKGVHNMIRRSKEICNICDMEFSSKQWLNYHIKSKHDKVKDLCIKCNESFGTEVELAHHKEVVHRKKCGICDQKFSSKWSLNRHMRSKHYE